MVAQPQKQLLEKETAVYYLLDNDKREDLQRPDNQSRLGEDQRFTLSFVVGSPYSDWLFSNQKPSGQTSTFVVQFYGVKETTTIDS